MVKLPRFQRFPDDGDFLAKAEELLLRYLWSSLFSDRYEISALSRAFAYLKTLTVLLGNPAFADADLAAAPALNRHDFPLADADALLVAGWPKAAGSEARVVLAVTHYLGAVDFSDNKKASCDSIQKREYDCVFQDALLSDAGIPSFLALNCALITWKTIRMIGRKDPLEYLQERVHWADEAVACERLKSHLIVFDRLATAQSAGLQGEALKTKLAQDFDRFLRAKAALVVAAMKQLVEGQTPSLDALWKAVAVHGAAAASGSAA